MIVLDENRLVFDESDLVYDIQSSFDTYKKGMKTKCKNLREKAKFERNNFDIVAQENEELKDTIRELTKGSDRFELMDL